MENIQLVDPNPERRRAVGSSLRDRGGTRYRLLLIDQNPNHAERLALYLRRRGLVVTITASIEEGEKGLRRRIPLFDLVVLVVSGLPEQGLAVLRKLRMACSKSYFFRRPLFLFVSTQRCNPRLRLRIERLGARYVRER